MALVPDVDLRRVLFVREVRDDDPELLRGVGLIRDDVTALRIGKGIGDGLIAIHDLHRGCLHGLARGVRDGAAQRVPGAER